MNCNSSFELPHSSTNEMFSPDANPHLYVHNVPKDSDENELRKLFGQYGSIESVRLKINHKVGPNAVYAFVTYARTADAQTALASLQGREIRGRALRIEYQRTNNTRPIGTNDRYVPPLKRSRTATPPVTEHLQAIETLKHHLSAHRPDLLPLLSVLSSSLQGPQKCQPAEITSAQAVLQKAGHIMYDSHSNRWIMNLTSMIPEGPVTTRPEDLVKGNITQSETTENLEPSITPPTTEPATYRYGYFSNQSNVSANSSVRAMYSDPSLQQVWQPPPPFKHQEALAPSQKPTPPTLSNSSAELCTSFVSPKNATESQRAHEGEHTRESDEHVEHGNSAHLIPSCPHHTNGAATCVGPSATNAFLSPGKEIFPSHTSWIGQLGQLAASTLTADWQSSMQRNGKHELKIRIRPLRGDLPRYLSKYASILRLSHRINVDDILHSNIKAIGIIRESEDSGAPNPTTSVSEYIHYFESKNRAGVVNPTEGSDLILYIVPLSASDILQALVVLGYNNLSAATDMLLVASTPKT